MRLAMSILVRDEADIIEENIRFHAGSGVDEFLITDKGSTDGTLEILQELTDEFDITLFLAPAFAQDDDPCISRMAHAVRERGSAEWVINSDADEFWFSDLIDLKQAVTTEMVMLSSDADTVGSIYCERNNMIPSREQVLHPAYTFKDNVFKVVDTLSEHPPRHTWHEGHNSTLLQKMTSKVISRVQALSRGGLGLSLSLGSRSNSRDGLLAAIDTSPHMLEKTNSHFIRVLHYPIRSYTQFETQVINHGQSMKKNQLVDPPNQRHFKFWYELYLQGELYSEYLSMVLPEIALQQLIIAEKIKIEDAFTQSNYSDAA